MPDPQRRKLYRAENKVWKEWGSAVAVTAPPGSAMTFEQHWANVRPRSVSSIYERSLAWKEAEREFKRFRRKVTTEQRRRLRLVVDAVEATPWWKVATGDAPVPVRVSGSKKGGASGGPGGVIHTTNTFGSSGPVIAHELAHVAVHRRLGTSGFPPSIWDDDPHGAIFAGAQIILTEILVGVEYAAALEAEYVRARVKFDKSAWPALDPDHPRGIFYDVKDWGLEVHAPKPASTAVVKAGLDDVLVVRSEPLAAGPPGQLSLFTAA